MEKCNHPGSAEGTRYADGGRDMTCGAWEGSPEEACGEQYYICPHGVVATGLTQRGEVCNDCRLRGWEGPEHMINFVPTSTHR